jgi:imidazolonepropionase-like amidohydrolase
MRLVFTDLNGATVERSIANGSWSESRDGEAVDLRHLVSVPGLADGHAHLAHADVANLVPGDAPGVAQRAYAAIEAGVLLVFDKGSSDGVVLSLTEQPPDRRPHLQAAGRMIAAEGGYFPGFAREVDEEDLAEAVREAATESIGWVKLVGDWPRKGVGPIANFDEAALSTAVRVAHEAGARVAIHTMAPNVASSAVRAGVDSIEHGLYLTDDDIRILGARGGMWVPTVLRMEAVIEQFGPERTAGRVVAEGLDRVRSLLPLAQAAGVTVLAGTDLIVPSARVADEAIRLVDYGLSPEQALRAVSRDAWGAAGLGVGFAPGGAADLVSFAVDPREEITALRTPPVVIRAGRVLRMPE